MVVKRAENLKPEISRRGSRLVLDFPRTIDRRAQGGLDRFPKFETGV